MRTAGGNYQDIRANQVNEMAAADGSGFEAEAGLRVSFLLIVAILAAVSLKGRL
jgi:hypothetical protein